MADEGIAASPASMNGAAAKLRERARGLQSGQIELSTHALVKDPASHTEVDSRIQTFGKFAHDQYQDAVALLVALSTRVNEAASGYVASDQSAESEFTRLLYDGKFQAADQRPR